MTTGFQPIPQGHFEELRQHVQRGMHEIESGEGIEIDGTENLRKFLEELKARGRERLKRLE